MDAKILKNTLKIHSVFTIIAYTFGYLFKSFIDLKFSNPFQWIIDIPTYTPTDRGLILFFFLLYHALMIASIYIVKIDKIK